jgi:mannose-6-phosphate isomerase-like protein (cupin superfamily)
MSVSAKQIDHLINEAKPVGGMVWNVMGQIYIPKQVDDSALWWEAIMPEESFIPPHSHSTQDEFLYLTEGELDMILDGEEIHAGPGKILSFPRYSTHGLFNNSGKTVKGIFWAEPTNKLFDLFKALHNVANPHEVIQISDAHDIHFQIPGQPPR